MPTLATLTQRERRMLSERLRDEFIRRLVPAESICEDGEHLDAQYEADFDEAVNQHCPEFDVPEILDAAFAFIAEPSPKDLRGEQALARTRAYRATHERDAAAQVKADFEAVHAMIGVDVNWFVRRGVLTSIFYTHPMIAYAFALEVNLRSEDAEFFDRIEERAVLFNKLRPGYLPELFYELDDFRVLTYDDLAHSIEQATLRLDRRDFEPDPES